MSPALKAQILDALAKVPPESFWGHAIRLFVISAHTKTDSELTQLVLDLQSQAADDKNVMCDILSTQFDFINNLQLKH